MLVNKSHDFFVISSSNCTEIESRFYGFAFAEDKFYINGIVGTLPINADGTYINVVKSDNTLEVYQDYNGGYGLYLYKQGDFFALSNSFQYLLDYIKGQVELSLNIDFAKYFITDELASLSVSETLINEVELLPKNIMVKIDLDSKVLTTIKAIDEPTKVPLDSEEGVKILDKWHYKWQSLLAGLQRGNHKITVDLTGGMDSRATFSIFNSSEIDLNNLRVNTSTGQLHTHKEDFEIASMIAHKYGFKLNKKLGVESIQISMSEAISDSFYSKLGTHKQMYFKTRRNKDNVFAFTGFGGESIRSHWDSAQKFISQRKSQRKDTFNTVSCEHSIETIISTAIDTVKKSVSCSDEKELMHKYYQSSRLRSHFGKNTAENFIGNIININPLMDRELQRLYTGDDTLLSLILIRYLDEIKDVKFDSGRSLNIKDFNNAANINKKYKKDEEPRSFSEFSIIDGTKKGYTTVESYTSNEATSKVIELYKSNRIESLITNVLGYEVYHRGYLELFSGRFIAERMMYSLLAIALAQEAVTYGIGNLIDKKEKHNKSNNLLQLEILDFFKTARVDMKNTGSSNNDIHIMDLGDKNGYSLSTPAWFNKQKDGVGYVLESKKLKHEFVLQCVGSGELVISLKGVDVKNIDANNRIEAWADFVSFKINDEEQLSNITPVWHDKPFNKKIKVEAGQVINIKLEWLPHSYDKIEFIKKVEEVYQNLPFRPI